MEFRGPARLCATADSGTAGSPPGLASFSALPASPLPTCEVDKLYIHASKNESPIPPGRGYNWGSSLCVHLQTTSCWCADEISPLTSCNTMGNSWIVLGLAPSTLPLMSMTIMLKHSHSWSQSYLTLQEREGGRYKLAARRHTLYFKLSSISCQHFTDQEISNKNLDFHFLLKKITRPASTVLTST